MKNFDIFIGIDWSGAKSPIFNKSIAVSLCSQGRENPELLKKTWSRETVAEWIADFEDSLNQKNQRALIGIDCNFGYAEAVGLEQFGHDYNYLDLWTAVEDSSKDLPNFFAQGYWSSPDVAPYFWVQGKRPNGFEMPQRITESVCGKSGYGRPESPFKLIGAKQVGKGGLSGMRMALYLKKMLGDNLCVWPFEREVSDKAVIVMTEIYPRQFLMRTGFGTRKIRTVEDLNAGLKALDSQTMQNTYAVTDHDTDALISAAGLRYLCGDDEYIPDNVANPNEMTDNAALREGWIFGVGDQG